MSLEFSEDWVPLTNKDDLEEYLCDWCDEYSADLGNLLGEPEDYPCLVKHAYDESADEYLMICVYLSDAKALIRADEDY